MVKSLKKTPTKLVVGGWTNPFEKYARQNGFIFPIFRGENKAYLKSPTSTPPKFNMEPEKKSLEKEVPLGNHHFQVPC